MSSLQRNGFQRYEARTRRNCYINEFCVASADVSKYVGDVEWLDNVDRFERVQSNGNFNALALNLAQMFSDAEKLVQL